MTNTFRGLDNRFGGGHSRSQAKAYLTTIVDPMVRHGRYTDTVRVGPFSATAELHQLIGWMACDTGQASIGRRHFRDGFRLYREVETHALAAEMLAGMSHHEMADGYERGRLFNTAVLAAALADQRRVDEACATVMLAVDMAGNIRSTRTVVYLSDVARRLAPFRTTADVRTLYERMADAGIPAPTIS